MSENKYNGEKIGQGEKQQPQNLGVWGGCCIFKLVRPGLTENDNWAKLLKEVN